MCLWVLSDLLPSTCGFILRIWMLLAASPGLCLHLVYTTVVERSQQVRFLIMEPFLDRQPISSHMKQEWVSPMWKAHNWHPPPQGPLK